MKPPPELRTGTPPNDKDKPYWLMQWGRESIALVLKQGSDVVDSAVRKTAHPLEFQEISSVLDGLSDDIDSRVTQANKLYGVLPNLVVQLKGDET